MQGEELRKIVGSNIHACRLNRQEPLTQTELARRIGVKPGFISQIEAGKASPSVDTLAAIAEELKVPPSFLMSLEGNFAMTSS